MSSIPTRYESPKEAALAGKTLPWLRARYPEPTKAQLFKALGTIKDKWQWDIRRVGSDPTKVQIGGGPEFDAWKGISEMPGENRRDAALALIVRAASVFANRIPAEVADKFASTADPGCDAYEREDAMLRGCRAYVCRSLDNLLQYGRKNSEGIVLEGFDALLDLTNPHSPESYETRYDIPVTMEEDVLAKVIAREKANRTKPPLRRPYGAPSEKGPSKESLKRAMKYVASNALGLSIHLVSKERLFLTVVPGQGFADRFEKCLKGVNSTSEKVAANSEVLLALRSIVEQADVPMVEAWVPDFDRADLSRPDKVSDLLATFFQEVRGRMEKAIEQNGHLGLRALAREPFDPELEGL